MLQCDNVIDDKLIRFRLEHIQMKSSNKFSKGYTY